MTEKNITQLLEQLREELAGIKAVDEKGQELLRALDADIHALLEHTEGSAADTPLLKRLQDTMEHFESSHPTLTTALSQMLNALSNAGI